MYKLRSLSGLLAFDATARLGSLTLAAKELGRTQSAVSQQVKALEEQLGLQLFVRGPSEISLTSEGRTFASAVRAAFEGMETSITALHRQDDTNTLRLTTFQSFAIHWLIPRLPKFNLLYPEIDVQINASDQQLNMDTHGFDVAIRTGTECNSSSIMQAELFVPVYAPSLAEGAKLNAEDVTSYRLLAHSNSSFWEDWLELNGLENQKVEVATSYSKSSLLVQAALAGGGVALTSASIAAEALRAGRLNCVKGEPLPTGDCYYLEISEGLSRKKSQTTIEAFCEWLHSEFKRMDAELPEYWS